MRSKLNRRTFLQRTALAAGAASFIGFPYVSALGKPKDKLRVAQVGCGGRAMTHLEQAINVLKQDLVAISDPDEKAHRRVSSWLKNKGIDNTRLRAFNDYRVMFDKMGKEIDAVFVATPNHHHAKVAMMAMERGINVYCEKPLCHDIAQARELREKAKHYNKVATQMGNQGHCEEGYRRLCEYIWSGAIGKVTETHSWTDRANGGVGPRPPVLPVPAGLDWESWIGPAPFRDFHKDLHPHEWHCWYDFGNGSIGNMACHVLDGVYWALKIDHPTSIQAEYIRGGTDERYPTGSRLRWDIPARADMPPLKVYWYEGLSPTGSPSDIGGNDGVKGASRYLPPLLAELKEKFPDDADLIDNGDSGTLYVGEKGIISTQTYGKYMHIVPMDKMEKTPEPPKTLPRPKQIFHDFVDTCLAGKTNTAVPFEYGARLTEFAILGNLAQRAGVEQKVEWDGPKMKVTNIPELNDWVKRPSRKGWEL
jgi:predicted dehydrogenase